MQIRNIEFADNSDDRKNNDTAPWDAPKPQIYHDMVLKPEYTDQHYKFPVGTTWLRILPEIKPSPHQWMISLSANSFNGGRFVHPKFFQDGGKSVFDQAYSWLKTHSPEKLFSKANKSGYRLLPDPLCAFWALVQGEAGPPSAPKLFVESSYDGSRGYTPGLGCQLWNLTTERDENSERYSDPIAPYAGSLISIERRQLATAKYPNFILRRGNQPAPLQGLLAGISPEETDLLRPLEEVLRKLTVEEQWQCLATVLAPDMVETIRASVG